jgi:hypothetical protein
MSISISVDMRGLQRAMSQFAALKGKSDEEVVDKAMRFWLPFASSHAKRMQRNPTGAMIRAELRRPSWNSRRAGKKRIKRGEFAGTVAEAIVAARWKEKGRESDKAEFLDAVRRMVEARVRGAGYLRSGFIPGFRAFNVPNHGVKPMKSSGHSLGRRARKIGPMMEAFARNAREGAMKQFPRAFEVAIPEVTAQFRRWIDEEYNKLAKKTGFY